MTDMKPIMGLTHKLRQATDSNVSGFAVVCEEKLLFGGNINCHEKSNIDTSFGPFIPIQTAYSLPNTFVVMIVVEVSWSIPFHSTVATHSQAFSNESKRKPVQYYPESLFGTVSYSRNGVVQK